MRWTILAAATLIPAAAATAQTDSVAHRRRAVERDVRAAAVDSAVDSAVGIEARMAVHRVPGVSVAVINGGRLEWAAGYGVRRAASRRPVGTGTRFQAASISKPVAAAAALQLVRAGQLDLDRDVNSYLHWWRVPPSTHSEAEAVTLRRLLSHSAGLTVHGFRGYARGEPVPTLLQVLDGRGPANSAPVRVAAVPGSAWRYSGGGYSVVQQLIEEITGEPFAHVVRKQVLTPAGMTRSTFEQPLPTRFASTAATAHDTAGRPIAGGWHTYPEQAAAGLWTTPSDLARFVIDVRNAYVARPTKWINQATARLMLTMASGDYGLGFRLDRDAGDLRFSHGGSNAGFRCLAIMHVGSGDGVVIMTNGDAGAALMREIASAVARVYAWPDAEMLWTR